MALDWLKHVLGDAYTEELDKQISAEIGKSFVAKDDFNSKATALKQAQEQLNEANKTIGSFKAMDIDGIQRTADEWKRKAEQAEQAAAQRVAEIEFESLLESEITANGGLNAKAVRALLDLDTLKASKNQREDVKAALEAQRQENAFLFRQEQATEQAAASGVRVSSASAHGTTATPDYNNMSDAEYYTAVLNNKK